MNLIVNKFKFSRNSFIDSYIKSSLYNELHGKDNKKMEIGIILNWNNAYILIEIPDIISDFLCWIVHQPFASNNHGVMPASDGKWKNLNRIIWNYNLDWFESAYVPDSDVALVVDGNEIGGIRDELTTDNLWTVAV